jgi:hypothetical protein
MFRAMSPGRAPPKIPRDHANKIVKADEPKNSFATDRKSVSHRERTMRLTVENGLCYKRH